METKVAPVATVPDILPNAVQPSAPQGAGAEPPKAAGPDPNELRLVIEEDQPSGTYVYKIIDRHTGQVVQQYPRDEVLRMRDAEAYGAGHLIKTTA